MAKWLGFVYAALAALGHSGIDATRKHASQRFNSAELVGLVGFLDAFFLSLFMVLFGFLPSPSSFLTPQLWFILIASSAVKILAGVMYQRALQVSPLSVTVPYLAFVPAMLLITSFVMLHEIPSMQGIMGVMVVTAGGYLLAVDNSKGTSSRPKQSQPLLLSSSNSPASTSKQQAAFREEKADLGLGSELGLGLPIGPPGKTSGPSRPGSAKAAKGSDPSFRQGRERLVFGSGIGLGFERLGAGRFSNLGVKGGLEAGEDGLAGKAVKGRGERGEELGSTDEEKDGGREEEAVKFSFMEGYAIRGVALSVLSLAWLRLGKVVEPLKALRKEEGSLLMLGCAALLSLTNSFDKMGVHNSPSVIVFAGLQRIFMAIPPVTYLLFTSPRSFLSLLNYFPIMAAISFFEMIAIVCYLKSLEWLLVSYSVAAKRSNILISVLVGHFMFKENIWRRLPFISIMLFGMILIVFAPS